MIYIKINTLKTNVKEKREKRFFWKANSESM